MINEKACVVGTDGALVALRVQGVVGEMYVVLERRGALGTLKVRLGGSCGVLGTLRLQGAPGHAAQSTLFGEGRGARDPEHTFWGGSGGALGTLRLQRDARRKERF